MTINENENEVREVVGVFDSQKSMQNAIDDLMNAGFDQSEISLLASPKDVDRKLGRRVGVEELEDNWDAPRRAYVSPESIGDAQGMIISILVYVGAIGAAALLASWGGVSSSVLIGGVFAGAAFGVLGYCIAKLLGKYQTRYITAQLNRGGLLVWVRAWDSDHERQAMEIFSRNAGHDVHVHSGRA